MLVFTKFETVVSTTTSPVTIIASPSASTISFSPLLASTSISVVVVAWLSFSTVSSDTSASAQVPVGSPQGPTSPVGTSVLLLLISESTVTSTSTSPVTIIASPSVSSILFSPLLPSTTTSVVEVAWLSLPTVTVLVGVLVELASLTVSSTRGVEVASVDVAPSSTTSRRVVVVGVVVEV